MTPPTTDDLLAIRNNVLIHDAATPFQHRNIGLTSAPPRCIVHTINIVISC